MSDVRFALRLLIRSPVHTITAALALALGIGATVGQLMRGLLFEVRPNDPATLVVVPILLALVALIACTVPARRAANTEPLTALRLE
jgi:putative ABC transport system permease protein